jgi:hypothetical protein
VGIVSVNNCLRNISLTQLVIAMHSSTRNVRIERMWVEVGTQFLRSWKAFFIRLEKLHGLKRDEPHHLWLLQKLFLSDINSDCAEFQGTWNSHPISRVGKNMTPDVSDIPFICRLIHMERILSVILLAANLGYEIYQLDALWRGCKRCVAIE